MKYIIEFDNVKLPALRSDELRNLQLLITRKVFKLQDKEKVDIHGTVTACVDDKMRILYNG